MMKESKCPWIVAMDATTALRCTRCGAVHVPSVPFREDDHVAWYLMIDMTKSFITTHQKCKEKKQ